MTYAIGDTIRVRVDEPNFAPIKAGTHGIIREITDEGTVFATFGGQRWGLEPDDFDVISINDVFASIMEETGITALDVQALVGLYDESGFETLPGVPVEAPETVQAPADPVNTPEGGIMVIEPEEAGHPAEPHVHDEQGSPVMLPFLSLQDATGDFLTAIDVRKSSEANMAGVGLVVRVSYQSGRSTEAHLTESQAIALAAFVFKNYR